MRGEQRHELEKSNTILVEVDRYNITLVCTQYRPCSPLIERDEYISRPLEARNVKLVYSGVQPEHEWRVVMHGKRPGQSSSGGSPPSQPRPSEGIGDIQNFTLSDYSQVVRDKDDLDAVYKLYFVLPEGDSEDTCSSRLSEAFQVFRRTFLRSHS